MKTTTDTARKEYKKSQGIRRAYVHRYGSETAEREGMPLPDWSYNYQGLIQLMQRRTFGARYEQLMEARAAAVGDGTLFS